MGSYLDGLIDNFVAQMDEGFYIEYEGRMGWFLFDVDQTKEPTKYLWSKESRLCLGWISEAASEQFLVESKIDPKKVNIIKIIR